MAFRHKRVLVGAMTAVACAVAAGAASREFAPEARRPIADSTTTARQKAFHRSPPSTNSVDESARERGSQWKIDETRTYSLDFGSRLEADASAPDGWFSVVGSASMQLTRVASPDGSGPAECLLRGELSKLSVVMENESISSQHLGSRIEKGLDKPFFLRVSEGGEIQALGTHIELEGMGYNILRTAVAVLQFVEPARDSPNWNVWETEETDQNGIYAARYRRRGGGGYEKTKLGYTYAASASLAPHDAPRLPTIQSVTQLIWTEGRLRKADLVESMVQPFGARSAFKTKLHIGLELVSERKAASRSADVRGITFLPLFKGKGAARPADHEQEHKEQLVAGASFQDLKAQLGKLPDTPQNRDARWNVIERLTALFQLDSAALQAAVKDLRALPASADRDMLLAAISDTDTPEARGALADLARDRAADPSLRDSVLTHLGVTEKSSVESLETLRAVVSDPADTTVRATAALALGAAAHAGMRSEGVEGAAAQAVETLSESYEQAPSPKEQRLYLDALGNSGNEAALDTIRRALTSPDRSVRAAAADALRRIPGAAAEALLATTLRNDPESSVRVAAVMALTARELGQPMLDALSDALRSEPEGGVRLQIISLLRGLQKRSAPARELLAWAARNDPDEQLRRIASQALQGA